MTQITNTLSGFKQLLESAQVNGCYMKITILDRCGNVLRENEPAPVGKVQSNCFALDRNGQLSYVEFGKASNWEFNLHHGKATKLNPNGNMIIEFKEPSFFGL